MSDSAAKGIDCRAFVSQWPADDEYQGLWSGYFVRFKSGGVEYEVRTDCGVRGINVPAVITVENGSITVRPMVVFQKSSFESDAMGGIEVPPHIARELRLRPSAEQPEREPQPEPKRRAPRPSNPPARCWP